MTRLNPEIEFDKGKEEEQSIWTTDDFDSIVCPDGYYVRVIDRDNAEIVNKDKKQEKPVPLRFDVAAYLLEACIDL